MENNHGPRSKDCSGAAICWTWSVKKVEKCVDRFAQVTPFFGVWAVQSKMANFQVNFQKKTLRKLVGDNEQMEGKVTRSDKNLWEKQIEQPGGNLWTFFNQNKPPAIVALLTKGATTNQALPFSVT